MKKKLFSNFELSLQPGFNMFSMGNVIASYEGESKHLFKKNENQKYTPLPNEFSDEEESSSGVEESYLSLGEKLMTLAKEQMPKHRNYTSIAKKLTSLEYNSTDLEGILSTMSRVIRPLLRSLEDDVMNSSAVQELKALTPHFSWRLCSFSELFSEENLETGICPPSHYLGIFSSNDTGVPPRYLSHKRKLDKNERTLYLYCPELWPEMLLLGMQIGTSKYKNAWLKRSPHLRVVDMAYALSYLIFLDTVWSNLLSADLQKTCLFKRIATCAGESFMLGTTRFPERILNQHYDNNLCAEPVKLSGDFIILFVEGYDRQSLRVERAITYLKEKGCDVYVVYSYQHFDLSENVLLSRLEEYFPSYEVQRLKVRSAAKKYHGYDFVDDLKELLKKYPLIGKLPKLISMDMLFLYMVWDSQHSDFSEKERDFLVSLMFDYNSGWNENQTAFPTLCSYESYSTPIGLFIKLYLALSKVMEKEIKYMEKENEDKRNHARAFETKRNIPQKILKIMENSTLNDRFGYIEYDEMCDIGKIETINAQILNFANTYFPNEVLKNIAIRFRRLGNYKAGGLYFPAYHCIAVELSHPSSFIHEFGHMLDYTHGMVSNRLNSDKFDAVYNRYVKLLEKKLEEVELLKKWKNGGKKSKYAYYIEETEVFARSFEVYITDALGIENSIIRDKEQYQENPYVYHLEDEEYMALVRSFFESLSFMEDVIKENNENILETGVA